MVIAISTDKVERDNGQLLCSTFCEGVLMLFVLGGQGGYTKINPGGGCLLLSAKAPSSVLNRLNER